MEIRKSLTQKVIQVCEITLAKQYVCKLIRATYFPLNRT